MHWFALPPTVKQKLSADDLNQTEGVEYGSPTMIYRPDGTTELKAAAGPTDLDGGDDGRSNDPDYDWYQWCNGTLGHQVGYP